MHTAVCTCNKPAAYSSEVNGFLTRAPQPAATSDSMRTRSSRDQVVTTVLSKKPRRRGAIAEFEKMDRLPAPAIDALGAAACGTATLKPPSGPAATELPDVSETWPGFIVTV